MTELIPTIVFYIFATVTVLSAAAVISARNPVHSVFFLIFAFFNAAGLFVLIGAEYLAMTLVIVYVGAVAVLFLFVVMMLNINFVELRQGFMRNVPLGVTVAGCILAELLLMFYVALNRPYAASEPAHPIPTEEGVTNTHAIGHILYTDYVYPFQVCGLILLVAMIGAITLTHRARPGVRRQKINKQLARTREEAVEVINVETGKGV